MVVPATRVGVVLGRYRLEKLKGSLPHIFVTYMVAIEGLQLGNEVYAEQICLVAI